MALEAVGLAASLASLLEISERIVAAGYGYIHKVAQVPSRMRMVLSEVSGVNLVLARLEEYSANQSVAGGTSILYTLSRNGIFEDCKELLKKIDGTILTWMAESEADYSKRKVTTFVKRVTWPMKEKETEDVLIHLDRLRSILSDTIAQDSAASLHRLEATTQQLHQTTINMANSQHHVALMAWVSPYNVDPFDDYQAALIRRQPGTGAWLTHSESFKTWSQHGHGMFWLRGLPGCGKTVLTSTIVEYVQYSLIPNHIGTTLAYFYIRYQDPAKQSLNTCLATLVRQMIDQNPAGMKKLEEIEVHRQRSFSHNLTTSEYIGIIKVLAELQTKVYIVIDALDETPDPGPFVDALRQLSDCENGTPVAVVVSSRNNTNLEALLMSVVTEQVLVSTGQNDDVRIFITTEVKKRFTSANLKVPNAELIDLTVSKLVARADGLFLYAHLLLEFVFAGKTSRSIRQALTHLPNSLEATYETILRRATSENQRHINEIKRSLQWLSMTFIPLTPTMLVEAAAIDPDDKFLDPEACMEEADLVGMLSSLVLVDHKHTPPIVSLAHQTVLEYLQSQSILHSDISQYHIDASTTHQYLAETAIQYLSFPDSAQSLISALRSQSQQTSLQSKYHNPKQTASRLVRATCSGFEQLGQQMSPDTLFLRQHSEMHYGAPALQNSVKQNRVQIGPCLTHASQEQALLNYVANLWPEHLKSGSHAATDLNAGMVRNLEWYLYPEHGNGLLYKAWEAFQRRRLSNGLYFIRPFRASGQQVSLQLLKSSYFAYIGHETIQNPFFYAILYGLDGCFDLLVNQYDVNMSFRGGWTPLTVAAASGSFSIAKKLLDAGANVNKAADMNERNGLTPLHIAAELAMEDLVWLFLEHGALTTSLTATMTTPFYRAARGGSIKVLQSLYDAGSDINAPSWDDFTPLMEAVAWSNHDAVDLLLSWGADPYLQNRLGQSSIDWVRLGDEGVAEKLKEAGSRNQYKPVDPETLRYRDNMIKRRLPPQEVIAPL